MCVKVNNQKSENQSESCVTTILGPTIAHKLHLLKLQMTCFLHQTKAASHC